MHHDSTPHDPTKAYEPRDVATRSVVLVAGAVVGLVVVSAVLMHGLLGSLWRSEAAASAPASPLAGYGPQTPPAPRRQPDPAGDIAALRNQQAAQLNGYGWVDRDKGVVRVPIARAMDLLVQRRGKDRP